MYPVLLKIPLFGLFGKESIPIYGYGVLLALGFLIGSWYVSRQAKVQGEDPAKSLDLVFYILLASIIGSRVMHVFVSEREALFQNPLHLFKIWEGGLVFYGGFIGSLLVAIWFFRKHRLPAWKYCDFFAPAVALGHAIGRQGCFLVGCCHGRPLLDKTWYSIVFPEGVQSLAPTGIPLYPTQLLESGGEFLIFLGLNYLLKRKKFDGQILSLYMMAYAALRFGIEFLRGDSVRGFVFESWMSTSQLIAIIMFAIGGGMYLYRGKR